MAENKKLTETLTDTSSVNNFPVPFTLDALRQDILFLYFQQVRTMGWMAGSDAVWKLIDRKAGVAEQACFDPDTNPKDIEFEYSEIASTEFAMSIEQMYQYAYFGIQDESKESMDDESIHTWISAVLSDLANSRVADVWEAYGVTTVDAAKRCLEVAELANARRVLEGASDNFFYFGGTGKDDDSTGFEALTIRQMALLAGMEEMSIRAAANPKRANPLPTYSDEGRTRIAVDVAKSWLESKGRYVAIKRTFSSGEIDLTKRRFKSLEDLIETINARIHMIRRRDNTDRKVANLLFDAQVMLKGEHGFSELNIDLIRDDHAKVEILAEALEFDSKLLGIRIREALANEELAKVDLELREIAEH